MMPKKTFFLWNNPTMTSKPSRCICNSEGDILPFIDQVANPFFDTIRLGRHSRRFLHIFTAVPMHYAYYNSSLSALIGWVRPTNRKAIVAAATVTTTGLFLAIAHDNTKNQISSPTYNEELSYHLRKQQEQQQQQQQQPLEVHLLDTIRNKSYLQGSHDAIPDRLRLLVIDLPDLPLHIRDGDCRISHSHLFPDDVAKPKRILFDWKKDKVGNIEHSQQEQQRSGQGGQSTDPSSISSKLQQIDIVQKAVVKSLRICRGKDTKSKVGLEILEASIADLNKYKLRKTHQVGSYKYDPGKYYNNSSDPSTNTTTTTKSDGGDGDDDGTSKQLDPYQEQLEAPWNQYAWAEELRLRIQGQIGFASPLESSSLWNWRGSAYRTTHHPLQYFWEWPLPPFARSDPDGIDGHKGSRASQKPHAVVANGAALQRVPSSMRLLQKLCQKADVPLFVVYDPRSWGGNTHATMPDALTDLRSTIKHRMISKALQQHGSTAFSRGRLLGQMETEAKWQLQEQKRKSKELFRGKNHRGTPKEDWSGYDANRLERRLLQRGLIRETTTSDGEGASVIRKVYNKSLVELARRCVGDHDEQEKAVEESSSNSRADDDDDDTMTTTTKKKPESSSPVTVASTTAAAETSSKLHSHTI